MKRIKRGMMGLGMILTAIVMTAGTVQAGGLNGPESALIGAASGTFTYNGQSYVASPDLLNQAVNYLCQDGVDLTQEQANAAIGSMYGMVAQGVAQGYLIPTGGGGQTSGSQGQGKNSAGTEDIPEKSASEAVKDAAELAGELGVKVTVDPANKKVTITNKDGKQILNFDRAIKNTGIPLDFGAVFFVLLAVYLVIAILLLVFAWYQDRRQPSGKPCGTGTFIRKNIFSPVIMTVMGAALIVILCLPARSLLVSTGRMILSKSVPAYSGSLDSIYDENSKMYKNKVSSDRVTMPVNETHYAMIRCENWNLDAKLYFGDTDRVLQEGIGQYIGSSIPGMGKPVLLTGHSNTFLSGMAKVQQGDIVTIRTNYGIYKYRINKSVIADASDASAYDLGQNREQLILYTCYPYNASVGTRKERHFLYGEKIAGPEIVQKEKGE